MSKKKEKKSTLNNMKNTYNKADTEETTTDDTTIETEDCSKPSCKKSCH